MLFEPAPLFLLTRPRCRLRLHQLPVQSNFLFRIVNTSPDPLPLHAAVKQHHTLDKHMLREWCDAALKQHDTLNKHILRELCDATQSSVLT